MNAEVVGFLIVAGLIGSMCLFSHSSSSIVGLDPVKQKDTRFHFIRTAKDGDGTLEIKSSLDGRVGSLVLDHGKLFEPGADASALALEPTVVGNDGKPLAGDDLTAWRKLHPASTGPFYTATFSPDYYFIEPGLDLGTFAAYRPGGRGSSASGSDGGGRGGDTFEVGLRYSPVRFFGGTVAPDALITRDCAGLGLSFYPPESLVGRWWHHLGLEVGWVAAFPGRGSDGWVAGLSFTTNP